MRGFYIIALCAFGCGAPDTPQWTGGSLRGPSDAGSDAAGGAGGTTASTGGATGANSWATPSTGSGPVSPCWMQPCDPYAESPCCPGFACVGAPGYAMCHQYCAITSDCPVHQECVAMLVSCGEYTPPESCAQDLLGLMSCAQECDTDADCPGGCCAVYSYTDQQPPTVVSSAIDCPLSADRHRRCTYSVACSNAAKTNCR